MRLAWRFCIKKGDPERLHPLEEVCGEDRWGEELRLRDVGKWDDEEVRLRARMSASESYEVLLAYEYPGGIHTAESTSAHGLASFAKAIAWLWR